MRYGSESPESGRPEGFRVRVPGENPLPSDATTYTLPAGCLQVVPGSSWGTFTIAATIPIALLVNNLGATPTMELAIVARRAVAAFEERGLLLERAYVGTFLSALEMAGVSLSVLRVDDRRLARLDAPTDAPAWPRTEARPRSLWQMRSWSRPWFASSL